MDVAATTSQAIGGENMGKKKVTKAKPKPKKGKAKKK
jgi:hypothetical protein